MIEYRHIICKVDSLQSTEYKVCKWYTLPCSLPFAATIIRFSVQVSCTLAYFAPQQSKASEMLQIPIGRRIQSFTAAVLSCMSFAFQGQEFSGSGNIPHCHSGPGPRTWAQTAEHSVSDKFNAPSCGCIDTLECGLRLSSLHVLHDRYCWIRELSEKPW